MAKDTKSYIRDGILLGRIGSNIRYSVYEDRWPVLMLVTVSLLAASCSSPKPEVQATPYESAESLTAPAGGQAPPSSKPAIVTTPTTTQDPFAEERLNLVKYYVEAAGITDPNVLRAMRTVPRHEFVPAEFLDQAYANHPLPIGYGQTISQPYVVAWMTELLELKPSDKVLEIGTGSGYQAAVLAELGYVDVYTIEIVPELAESAAARLEALGYGKVHVKQGDGYYGWPEFAPFDAIIVTAAPDHLPGPLAGQLADGGKLVIPIGPPGWYQSLWKFAKEKGELKAYNMGGVSFVPLTGLGVEQPAFQPGPTP